jgi:hypothetical protein
LRLGNGEISAEIMLCPADRIRVGQWGEAAAFAQTDLNRGAYLLARGTLYLPGTGDAGTLPVVPLGHLGHIGPDRRDIHDAFKITTTHTPYAAFWGHRTGNIQTIAQRHNRFLAARTRAARGRNLRDADLLWSRSGRLLVAERLRLNTARLMSVHVDRRVLSNTWWPVAVQGEGNVSADEMAKMLALWLNSSLGILSMIAARVDTEGAWVDLKKPILTNLPVLNPSGLTTHRRDILLQGYAGLAHSALKPLTHMQTDPVRARIDEIVLQAIGVTSTLAPLRELIEAEPLFAGAAKDDGDNSEDERIADENED